MKSLPSLQVYTKILELIDTHSGGLSLSEIANLLDLPKSTISSILKPLGATSQCKDFLATQKMYVCKSVAESRVTNATLTNRTSVL